MQFMVVFRRSDAFDAADFEPLLAPEVQAAKALYQSGTVRQIWHRGDEAGAVLLLEADNRDQAQAKLNTLPMVEAKMLETVMLIPLQPYRGFAP